MRILLLRRPTRRFGQCRPLTHRVRYHRLAVPIDPLCPISICSLQPHSVPFHSHSPLSSLHIATHIPITNRWEANTGFIRRRISGHEDVVYRCLFTPDGNVVSCSHDKKVMVWQLEEGVPAEPTNLEVVDVGKQCECYSQMACVLSNTIITIPY